MQQEKKNIRSDLLNLCLIRTMSHLTIKAASTQYEYTYCLFVYVYEARTDGRPVHDQKSRQPKLATCCHKTSVELHRKLRLHTEGLYHFSWKIMIPVKHSTHASTRQTHSQNYILSEDRLQESQLKMFTQDAIVLGCPQAGTYGGGTEDGALPL